MRKDPERLPRDAKPVVVSLETGEETFAATHETLESGWLWVELWDGTRRKLPPQRIMRVDTVETTAHRKDGTCWHEVSDPELVEQAKQAAGLDDRQRRAVADGGERDG
ncbi:hypothetical protein ACFQJ7_13850 [Halovenus rubra]|uniref:Uncharacterized protein n=2 Tax=Halovenus rubra TaxID=869890 RepID=A0ACC7E0C2_9EURY|nr:hypothetical protein [Halovenus rubra]